MGGVSQWVACAAAAVVVVTVLRGQRVGGTVVARVCVRRVCGHGHAGGHTVERKSDRDTDDVAVEELCCSATNRCASLLPSGLLQPALGVHARQRERRIIHRKKSDEWQA